MIRAEGELFVTEATLLMDAENAGMQPRKYSHYLKHFHLHALFEALLHIQSLFKALLYIQSLFEAVLSKSLFKWSIFSFHIH